MQDTKVICQSLIFQLNRLSRQVLKPKLEKLDCSSRATLVILLCDVTSCTKIKTSAFQCLWETFSTY